MFLISMVSSTDRSHGEFGSRLGYSLFPTSVIRLPPMGFILCGQVASCKGKMMCGKMVRGSHGQVFIRSDWRHSSTTNGELGQHSFRRLTKVIETSVIHLPSMGYQSMWKSSQSLGNIVVWSTGVREPANI